MYLLRSIDKLISKFEKKNRGIHKKTGQLLQIPQQQQQNCLRIVLICFCFMFENKKENTEKGIMVQKNCQMPK